MGKEKGRILTQLEYDERVQTLFAAYLPALSRAQEVLNDQKYIIDINQIIKGLLILGSMGGGFNSRDESCHPHQLSDVDGLPVFLQTQRGDFGVFNLPILATQLFFVAYDKCISNEKKYGSKFRLDQINSSGCMYQPSSLDHVLRRARLFSPEQLRVRYITHIPNSVSLISDMAKISRLEVDVSLIS